MSEENIKTVAIQHKIKRDGQTYHVKAIGICERIEGTWTLTKWSSTPLKFELTGIEKTFIYESLCRDAGIDIE